MRPFKASVRPPQFGLRGMICSLRMKNPRRTALGVADYGQQAADLPACDQPTLPAPGHDENARQGWLVSIDC